MIKLVEQSGRIQSFNLPHEQYCARVGSCSCRSVTVTLTDVAGGKRRPRPVRRRFCSSMTLLPGQTSDPLPVAVLEIDEVRVGPAEDVEHRATDPADKRIACTIARRISDLIAARQ